MIDPAKVCFYIPPGLQDFKLNLFERVARHIKQQGGQIIRHDETLLGDLPTDIIPIVGCTPALTSYIQQWRASNHQFLYWDRGFCRRVFATWLPRGDNGGYYRWIVGAYQTQRIRHDLPDDRWRALKIDVSEWKRGGRHIVIAAPTRTYSRFHRTENWIADTIDALSRVTDRQLIIRDKASQRPLQADLDGAHALVAHGSIAAVESVICGCPVFVHPDSAAALVGKTDLRQIETPVYPERQPWLNSLSYSQFNEKELVDGTLWKLINADHPLSQH